LSGRHGYSHYHCWCGGYIGITDIAAFPTAHFVKKQLDDEEGRIVTMLTEGAPCENILIERT